jgi:CBS domain containing-hemolysin-like protein
MPLTEAAEFMSIDLKDDSVETVGGWVMRQAGRIPETGDVITHNGFRMTILEGGGNVVNRIRLDIEPSKGTPSAKNSDA